MLIGLLVLVLCLPSLSCGQIGGTTMAGTQWEDNFRVRNGWYNSNFGAVVFDGDNDGHEEVWLLGGQSNGGPDAITSQNYSGAGYPSSFRWTPRVPAPWSNRSDFEAVVYLDKVWVFAGKETAVSDVWFAPKGLVGDPQSEQTLGLDWHQAADAPWPTRGGYEAEVFNGKIWLMGGYDGTNFRNDVWSFDGTTWQQEADAPWPGRDGFTSVVLDGELYVIGGRSNNGSSDYVLSDVWKTADGVTWNQVTANMNIGPIREHASVVFDDRIWIIGGNISTDDLLYDPLARVSITDEVWWSADGATWSIASAYGDAPFARLQGHEVLVVDYYQNNKITPHSQLQPFPRMLFTGGRAANSFANGYVYVDRRDHELTPYISPIADSMTIQSPRGNQASRTTSSSIVIPEDILISDLNIRLNMTHSRWSDITKMVLVLETTDEDGSPINRPFDFMNNSFGGWGSGTFNSVITDEGGQAIGANTPGWYDYDPLPRYYAMRPGWYANWYDGFNAKGTWTLEITDSARGEDGELHSWSLEIRGMPLAASPGISVSPNQGLVTTEAGAQDSFEVVLESEPIADVTIEIMSSNVDEGTVDTNSLTFTPANWSTPQTVTVTGVDDAIEDGDVGYIITAAATSTDPDYDGLDADDVSVTNLDDEQPMVLEYSSADTPLAIPDNDPGGVSSLIGNVADHAGASITVTLAVAHSRLSDLEAWVTVNGTQVTVNVSGDTNISGMIGDTQGDWFLTVRDTRNRKEGDLLGWSITVEE